MPMTKRFTITTGPDFQKVLAKLARKLSLETSSPWDSQDVIVRMIQIGANHSVASYYPKDKVPAIRD